MVRWVAAFLFTALMAALLGFSGIVTFATPIAWTLFLFGLATAIVLVLFDRRSPVA